MCSEQKAMLLWSCWLLLPSLSRKLPYFSNHKRSLEVLFSSTHSFCASTDLYHPITLWKRVFLVAAFLKKRVDHSHGFSSAFFQTTWSDQNSLPKVLQNFKNNPNCTCWPKELNQKGFPRNIQYRTRPKGLFWFFFGTVWLFCKSFFHPSFFWSFATAWMLKNPKGSLLSVFSALWDFFQFFFVKGSKFTNTLTFWSPFAIF